MTKPIKIFFIYSVTEIFRLYLWNIFHTYLSNMLCNDPSNWWPGDTRRPTGPAATTPKRLEGVCSL